MGMGCIFRALTVRQIELLVAKPDLTWKFLLAESGKTELSEDPLRENLNLDKSWSILQYLLEGVAQEVDSYEVLISGDSIGEQSDFSGPYLRDIADTRSLAAFLAPITVDQLLSYFDAKNMDAEGVYFAGYDNLEDEGVEDEVLEYAEEHFLALRDYVVKAAEQNCGLLLVVG